MYYEEKVINGILSHKSSPNGEWVPFSAEQLTQKILDIKIAKQMKLMSESAL